MINISKTACYGLQGLLYLICHREDGFVKIEEISKSEHIPQNYLRKIFQQLIKNRVLESVVGPKGGVKLAPDSYEFSLARIIKIFEGEPVVDECTLFGTRGCRNLTVCPLQVECHSYNRAMWDKLEKFKIKDFISPNKK